MRSIITPALTDVRSRFAGMRLVVVGNDTRMGVHTQTSRYQAGPTKGKPAGERAAYAFAGSPGHAMRAWSHPGTPGTRCLSVRLSKAHRPSLLGSAIA